MTESEKQWTVEFYGDARGKRPVLDYLAGLAVEEEAKVRKSIRWLCRLGVKITMPHARRLKGHMPLWELRPKPHRVFYFLHTGRRFVLLHAVQKQRGKLRPEEIEIAERRMYEYLERVG